MEDNTNTTPPIEPPVDVETPEPTQEPEPQKRTGLIIGLAAAAVLLIVGGVTAWALLHTSPVTVRGSIMLMYEAPTSKYDTPNYVAARDKSDCWGDGGYDDIQEGASVKVYGAEGQVLGVGELGSGLPIEEVGCIFSTSIEVPGGEKFYSMEVTHRGELTASADEIEDGTLSISGSLGG